MTKECKDADITISPINGMVKIFLDDAFIGESNNAVGLQEGTYPLRYYLPPTDIDPKYLTRSDHTSHCPFKGDARYHNLSAGGKPAENAVWYYDDPCPLVEPVRDHLSFWGDRVRIQVDAPG